MTIDIVIIYMKIRMNILMRYIYTSGVEGKENKEPTHNIGIYIHTRMNLYKERVSKIYLQSNAFVYSNTKIEEATVDI